MSAKTLKNKIIIKKGILDNITTNLSLGIIAYTKKNMKHSVIYIKNKK